MNTLFIGFHAFLLLFIFLAGGFNKIIHFKDIVNALQTQIKTIQLDPLFILAVIVTIFYFYTVLTLQVYNKNKNLYFFLLTIVTTTIVGLPFLVLLKEYFKKNVMFLNMIFNITIIGVILLLLFGSLIILYSLLSSMYKDYAYIATIGLATFTAMTILIFHFPTNKSEVTNFTKNLSIFGGLMLLSQRFI